MRRWKAMASISEQGTISRRSVFRIGTSLSRGDEKPDVEETLEALRNTGMLWMVLSGRKRTRPSS